MMALHRKLAALTLLVLVVGAQAGQLTVTNVSIGSVSRDVVSGQPPTFVDVNPTSGPNGDSYQVQIQVNNTGTDLTVTAEDVHVYVGSFTGTVPPNADMLQVDTSGVCFNTLSLHPPA